MPRRTNHNDTISSQEEAEFSANYGQGKCENEPGWVVPYSYPSWIKFSILLIVVAWLWIVPRLVMELPSHKNLYHSYQMARVAFAKEDYAQALTYYQDLFTKNSCCRETRIRLAEIFFMADEYVKESDYSLYDTAIFYLGNLKYSKEELLEIQSYLSYSQFKSFQSHMKSLQK